MIPFKANDVDLNIKLKAILNVVSMTLSRIYVNTKSLSRPINYQNYSLESNNNSIKLGWISFLIKCND